MVTKDALKLKTCKASVRRDGVRQACGKQYVAAAGKCPDAAIHLYALRTGFCLNKQCEGTKPKDDQSNPMPTCKFYVTCPCQCHDFMDRLFKETGEERKMVDISGYSPPARTYWMPSDDPLPPLSNGDGDTTPEIIESPLPDAIPARVARDFKPTPTGRAARGELEAWVQEACDVWLVDKDTEYCTPVYLAEEIAHKYGITPPSVGAISAVFERWVKLGFAVIAKKPTRFVKYTDEGVELGLERMKEIKRREKARQRANQRRGIR